MSSHDFHQSLRTALASAKADTIKSNALVIDAKAGNDRIIGGSAAQTLYGGSGNDTLQGVGGDDILWGDGSSTGLTFVAGKDTFVFEKTLAANGVDTVMDFGIAGHKTAGVLQAGGYVADTLDLSRVQFTGLPGLGAQDDEGDCGHDEEEGEEVHITAANVNDYVSVQGGDLYIDTDGLGAGKAEVWAHLNGVGGGDLVNLKFDDFQGQIEAKPGFDFEIGMINNDMNMFALVLFIIDGALNFSINGDGALMITLNGKPITEAEVSKFMSTDLVAVQATATTDTQTLELATWSINGQQALGTIDPSTWITESALVNYFKFNLGGVDQTGDSTFNYDDVLAYDSNNNFEAIPEALGIIDQLKAMFSGQVLTFFESNAFAASGTVELIGTYQGSAVSHSMVAA
jgi:hypothetical protein